MTVYAARRVLQTIPLLLLLSVLVFFMIRLAPGDPVAFFIPETVTDPTMRERIIVSLGLDQPIHIQYIRWLGGVVRGDFGTALSYGVPVTEIIMARLGPTLELQVTAILFSIILAIPVGIISATRRNSIGDHLVTTGSLFGLSMPDFWFALMLTLVFSLKLQWLPSFGSGGSGPIWTRWEFFIMPVIVLGLRTIPWYARFMRSSMLDVLNLDFIRTARAKGLNERKVLYKHALRNAILPVITIIGLSLPRLVGGAIIVEAIFAWPGIGRLAYDAVLRRDYPIIMGLTMMTAAFVLLCNLIVDILYVYIDPRIRFD